MKTCPYCKTSVGGDTDKCPLCQSRLMGSDGDAYFPVRDTLKFRSFLYKLQLFIVWALVITGLGLDFLYDIRIPGFADLHWSLIIFMWLMVFEFVIIKQFKPGMTSARTVTVMVIVILAMLLVTAYFFNFMWLARDWIVPIVITGTMIANFVLAMVDRHGNAMAYMLTGLFFGLLPCLVLYLRYRTMPITWKICTMVGIVLFAGAVIFKGRLVASEIRKRFSM